MASSYNGQTTRVIGGELNLTLESSTLALTTSYQTLLPSHYDVKTSGSQLFFASGLIDVGGARLLNLVGAVTTNALDFRLSGLLHPDDPGQDVLLTKSGVLAARDVIASGLDISAYSRIKLEVKQPGGAPGSWALWLTLLGGA